MKTKLITSIVASFFLFTGMKAQNNVVLEGQYMEKNIRVKNAYGKDGIGYCVSEIKVNGKMTKDKINADTFEIDLSKCGLKKGDKVKVEIICKNDCTASVLNPDALK